jgi:hypothetical protein
MIRVTCLAVACLAVFSSACASQQPRTYQQGVPVRPPPAAVRPGVGAPLVGQPGTAAGAVPRSPHSRALPPSREPGLWAGDEPRASARAAEPGVRLGPVLLPFPDDADTGRAQGPATACATALDRALVRTKHRIRYLNLKPDAQKCVAMLLYARCAASLKEGAEKMRATGAKKWTDEDMAFFRATDWKAQAERNAACGGIKLDNATQSLVDDVSNGLPEAIRGGSKK